MALVVLVVVVETRGTPRDLVDLGSAVLPLQDRDPGTPVARLSTPLCEKLRYQCGKGTTKSRVLEVGLVPVVLGAVALRVTGRSP